MATESHAQSQSVIEEQNRLRLDIESRERFRLDEIEQRDRITGPGADLSTETTEVKVVKEATCRVIDEIEVVNATVFGSGEWHGILLPYLSRCLGLQSIQNLLKDINAAYIERGHVTSRAAIGEQSLSDRVLEITVVEGRVGKIRKAEPEDGRYSIGTAFPGLEDELLNMRDFEQGLDQLNRLPGVSIRLDYVPADRPGYSDVVIYNEPGKPWELSLTVDNNGSPSTRRLQGEVGLTVGNLLSFNDQWTLTGRTNLNDPGGRRSNSVYSLSGTLPYGYWTLFGNYSRTAYRTVIEAPHEEYANDGSSEISEIRIEHMLYRDAKLRISTLGGVTHGDSVNYLDDIRIGVSSQRRTRARLGLSAGLFTDLGNMSLEFAHSKGLDWFGASEQTGNSELHSRINHLMLNYSNRWRTEKGGSLDYNLGLTGQYALDKLQSETFSIGGKSTVRGPLASLAFGDSGYTVRNDLSYTLPPGDPFIRKIVGDIAPYLFLDYGHVTTRDAGSDASLLGSGFGLRTAGGPLSLDLFYGRLLAKVGDTFEGDEEGVLFQVAVSY
jgi:hemolysin activation/secretion protein